MENPIQTNEVKIKALINDFNDYNKIQFFEFNRNVTLPTMRKHQANLKASLLYTGTKAVTLEAIEFTDEKNNVYYKIVDGANRFIVCRDNNWTFNLKVLVLNDMSDKGIDGYITRINSSSKNWGTNDYETKLIHSSLANPHLRYMDDFAKKHGLSTMERNYVFINKQSIQYKAGVEFSITDDQKHKAELIVTVLKYVKGKYISDRVMVTRHFIKALHYIEVERYAEFTQRIVLESKRMQFSENDFDFKLRLNHIGEDFDFKLSMNKKTNNKSSRVVVVFED